MAYDLSPSDHVMSREPTRNHVGVLRMSPVTRRGERIRCRNARDLAPKALPCPVIGVVSGVQRRRACACVWANGQRVLHACMLEPRWR